MMLKHWLSPAFALVLLVTASGVRRPALWQPAPAAEPDTFAGQIALVKGKVAIKFKGANRFTLVAPNTNAPFRLGDLLRVDENAQAVVFCPDKSKHELAQGFHPLPCRRLAGGIPLSYQGSHVVPPRSGAEEAAIPRVISPRGTGLLNPRPTIRWAPVQGATKYTVVVRSLKELWRQEVKIGVRQLAAGASPQDKFPSLTLTYPHQVPALTLGENYFVSVTANGRSSDEEEQRDAGFSLLERDMSERVRAEERTLRALRLSAPATQFIVAQLYGSYSLNAEAIEILISLTRQAPSAVVWGALGDRYRTIGLNQFAAQCYTNAAAHAQQAQEIAGEALARYALGRTYAEALGNQAGARQQLQTAQRLYEQLGDTSTVKHIAALLAEL